MKYIVLVPDGAADYPLDELAGRTPLEAATGRRRGGEGRRRQPEPPEPPRRPSVVHDAVHGRRPSGKASPELSQWPPAIQHVAHG